jgi:hypothetical protein
MSVIVKPVVLDLVETANVRDAGGLSGSSMPLSPTKIAAKMESLLNDVPRGAQLVQLQLLGETLGQVRFLAVYNVPHTLVNVPKENVDKD